MIGSSARQTGPPVGHNRSVRTRVNISSAIKLQTQRDHLHSRYLDPRRAMLTAQIARPPRPDRAADPALAPSPRPPAPAPPPCPSPRRRRTAPAAIPRFARSAAPVSPRMAGPYSASKRGLTGPRSRRSTRSGGISRSRSNGGRPKPSRSRNRSPAPAGSVARTAPVARHYRAVGQARRSSRTERDTRPAGPPRRASSAKASSSSRNKRTISVSVAPTQRRDGDAVPVTGGEAAGGDDHPDAS